MNLLKSNGYRKVGNPYRNRGDVFYPLEIKEYTEYGIASWYGDVRSDTINPTANGEVFDRNGITAAHRTIQIPSIVKITNIHNGLVAIVKVNDRGPFIYKDRIIDVSEFVAKKMRFHTDGLTNVKIEFLRNATKYLEQIMKYSNRIKKLQRVKSNNYQQSNHISQYLSFDGMVPSN